MRPRLQIAVDSPDLVTAFSALHKAAPHVDIIECGTILIISEGMRAVREIRALYPEKTILADVRIAEAGAIISRQCFEAGADWVSCVAGASLKTIEQAVEASRDHEGQVQVELADEWYDVERAHRWFDLGVQHVIVKRSRDREAAGDLSWGKNDFARISELADMGFTVTVTGGIKAKELDVFAGLPVGVIITGRSIMEASDPATAAQDMQTSISQVWP